MKALVCEMCGSQDVVKQDGLFVCQHCGTKYSVEEARKMMIEGTVRIDTSEEVRNLYELARRAKESKNNKNAAKYYDMILIKEPSSWEANFFTVYFQAMTCKIGEIASAATNVNNCIHSTFILIRDKVADAESRRKAIIEVKENAYAISNMLYNAATNHFQNIDAIVKDRFQLEYVSNVIAAGGIKAAVCDKLCEIFLEDKEVMSTVGIDILKKRISEGIAIDSESLYVKTITRYEPSYQPPKNQTAEDIMKSVNSSTSNNSGGCYIATAVYGSYDCPEVWSLRRFRDNTLAESWYGRAFIHCYYAISPTLVNWFGKTNWFKKLWKPTLDRMVDNLNRNGVENTPYKDHIW